MSELIERDALKNHLYRAQAEAFKRSEWYVSGAIQSFIDFLDKQPTIEAEHVTHCKDCIYYHKAHVKRKDGTECDISEVPEEYKPFPLTNLCNSDYGINVGGKCEYDNDYAPYEEDKTVFRQPEDFCSRGKRKMEVNKNAGSIHAE